MKHSKLKPYNKQYSDSVIGLGLDDLPQLRFFDKDVMDRYTELIDSIKDLDRQIRECDPMDFSKRNELSIRRRSKVERVMRLLIIKRYSKATEAGYLSTEHRLVCMILCNVCGIDFVNWAANYSDMEEYNY